MAPVMARAEVAIGTTGRQRGETPSCRSTTLYDLITALQAVVAPQDDALVVATVVHLLRSGRLTWRGKARTRLDQARYNGDAHQATPLLTGRLGAVPWGGDIHGEGCCHSTMALEGNQKAM
jgi:hypothetical protein